jgi:integrase
MSDFKGVNVRDVEVILPSKVPKNVNETNSVADLREYLEPRVIDAVLQKMPPGPDRMLVATLWMTGLRVTEVISLKKRDFDFVNNRARVRHLKSKKSSERVIPLKKELAVLLNFYTSNLRVDDLVFPITRRQAHRIVVRWFGEGVHPHTFRHSFAVNFLNQSKSPSALLILQRLLGHAHLQDTLIYLSLAPNDLALALEEVSF